MKKAKRYEDGGYLLDGSGNRVKDGSGEDIMTGSGREEAETQKRMKAAEAKLAREVQEMVKEKSDSKRLAMDAEEGAKAPASSVKMPARPVSSSPKEKSSVVTKEELAKSGLSLRDYMNKQKGLTRRDGSAPDRKASAPAVSSSYRSEGAGKEKPAAAKSSTTTATPAKKEGSSFTAFPKNASLMRQRDEAEKKRDAARAAKRSADEAEEKARPAKDAAQRKMLSEQPGAVAYRKKREEEDKMSPGQRSAARGKAVKEFFGMAKGGSINGIAKRGLTNCKMR